MPDVINRLKTDKKFLLGMILYLLIILTYLVIAITSIQHWRNSSIEESPTVYVTPKGKKYHRSYHYQGRNNPISLFKAAERNYSPCKVCKPPFIQEYSTKPNFYLYNWLLMSIGISILFWVIFNQVNKKHSKKC